MGRVMQYSKCEKNTRKVIQHNHEFEKLYY